LWEFPPTNSSPLDRPICSDQASKIPLVGRTATIPPARTATTNSRDRAFISSWRDQLAIWAGHWKVHAETKETQFGHAKTADYDSKCSFQPHGAFMVCDAMSLQPDAKGRITDDLNVFYYNDVDKTFKHKGVGPEEEGGALDGVVLVDGNVWTRPLELPTEEGGVVNARFIYTFVSPDKQTCRFEISTDKGAHWTLVTDFIGTKQS
jgi:hypothetical protein